MLWSVTLIAVVSEARTSCPQADGQDARATIHRRFFEAVAVSPAVSPLSNTLF